LVCWQNAMATTVAVAANTGHGNHCGFAIWGL
jgi:hypothetical protein